MVDNIYEEETQQKVLSSGLAYAERFINRQYLAGIDIHQVADTRGDYKTMRLYRINKLVYESDENTNDKLISVFGALNSIQSSAMLVIRSLKTEVEIYMGTRCSKASTAGSILKESMSGNFGGSEIINLPETDIINVLGGSYERMNISSVTLVPSLRDEEKEHYVQGLEKLIDSMKGREFTAYFIAEPLSNQAIEEKKRGLEHLYATISPFAETSLSYGTNYSKAVAEGTFQSFSSSINESVSNSTSQSEFSSHADGTNSSFGFNSSSSDGESSSGTSASFGSSSTDSYGSSQAWSNAVSKGHAETDSMGGNTTFTETEGNSRTLSVKYTNKSVTELMDHIDRQLKRIRECESFGLWSVAAYFVSSDLQTTVIGASTLRALLAGDDTQIDRTFINTWDSSNGYEKTQKIFKCISRGMHPLIQLPKENQFKEQTVKPTVLLSGKELPMFLTLPYHSVPGLAVDRMASFGRAVFDYDGAHYGKKIPLGCIMHKGVKENVKVELEMEEFRSHCFITGSTGSGKSNTTYHLLSSFLKENIKCLVIEPAKGEYKYAFGGVRDINIFWTNPNGYRLLHLNPFSFPEEIHILEHLDRLIEIFNACWPLYSAMPAILKAGVERAYQKCGWDLINSVRVERGDRIFPTFLDLVGELTAVIRESSYSADTKGDYTGALVTRVSSLTNGIMGSIFCSEVEIDDQVLFDENTIIDLSRVGSFETKSLIMGILVMKLNEHRMAKSEGMNLPLRHITVLEEAHNLLKRVNTQQSSEGANVAGKSVEMISNSIAEMRTYGEGFIIVDQSPTAVDISAIKNTNTKIVMRLPEKSDFETIGNAFSLDDDQIREIARLRRGAAIVSQSGWNEPVMVSIDRATDEYEVPVGKIKRDLLDDGCIEKIIDLVTTQLGNQHFNERSLQKLLGESRISINRKETIKNGYKILVEKEKNGDYLNDLDKARFVIEAVGCKELGEICDFNMKENSSQAEAKKTYRKWSAQIVEFLRQYIVTDNTETYKAVAHDLLVYMALVERKKVYQNALWVLSGKGKE